MTPGDFVWDKMETAMQSQGKQASMIAVCVLSKTPRRDEQGSKNRNGMSPGRQQQELY